MSDLDEIKKAQKRVSPHLHRTPILTSSHLNEIAQKSLYFKCENFQKTGSFKARGALNAVLSQTESGDGKVGFVTHSSGNHGQALAWACSIAEAECRVVVPNNAPKIKCDAIEGYGAELHFCEPDAVSRVAACQRIVEVQKNSVNISPRIIQWFLLNKTTSASQNWSLQAIGLFIRYNLPCKNILGLEILVFIIN